MKLVMFIFKHAAIQFLNPREKDQGGESLKFAYITCYLSFSRALLTILLIFRINPSPEIE